MLSLFFTCEEGQDINYLCHHKIDRNLEEMHNLIKVLYEKLRKANEKRKKKKDLLSYFSPQERQFMCGYPTLRKNSFDFHNLPTMHFKIHLFDFLKKLNYQMNYQRINTYFVLSPFI